MRRLVAADYTPEANGARGGASPRPVAEPDRDGHAAADLLKARTCGLSGRPATLCASRLGTPRQSEHAANGTSTLQNGILSRWTNPRGRLIALATFCPAPDWPAKPARHLILHVRPLTHKRFELLSVDSGPELRKGTHSITLAVCVRHSPLWDSQVFCGRPAGTHQS